MEGSLHLESAAADLVSNPTIKVSMGTKMPPPPTPPTVPQADPRNPIRVTTTRFQFNSNSCIQKRKPNKQVSSMPSYIQLQTHIFVFSCKRDEREENKRDIRAKQHRCSIHTRRSGAERSSEKTDVCGLG
jgi:hypothetical protein